MTRVSPSILSADFSKLGEEVARADAAGADWIHLDVMDGKFVPNITFGPPVIGAVRGCSDRPFDAHLMIEEPVRYVDAFADAGCDAITVHAESLGDVGKALDAVEARGLLKGVSINPETPVEVLEEWLPRCDVALIMSVHPGFGGQSFIPDVLGKISAVAAWAREHNPSLEISVDGGINAETGRMCVDAGATMLVAGSYLFGKDDMAPAVAGLKSLGPDAGARDGRQPLPAGRGRARGARRPAREDRGRRRLQHDLPVPLDNPAAGRQAAHGRRGEGHLPALRAALQGREPGGERRGAHVRLRREAERAQGRDHRGAHRPEGEGHPRVRGGAEGGRHGQGLLQGAADLPHDAGRPGVVEGAAPPDGDPRGAGPERRGGAGRLHVRQGVGRPRGLPGLRLDPLRRADAGQEPDRLRQEEDAREERLPHRAPGGRGHREDAGAARPDQGAAGRRVHPHRDRLQPRRPRDRAEEGAEADSEARPPRGRDRRDRLRSPGLRRGPLDLPGRAEVGRLLRRALPAGLRRRGGDDGRARVLAEPRGGRPEEDGGLPQGRGRTAEAEVPGQLVPIGP